MKINVTDDISAGDDVELSCEVTGPSLPIFEWRNGSQTLSLSSRVRIETNNKVSKMFIRKTEKSDSGIYSCLARFVKTFHESRFSKDIVRNCIVYMITIHFSLNLCVLAKVLTTLIELYPSKLKHLR